MAKRSMARISISGKTPQSIVSRFLPYDHYCNLVWDNLHKKMLMETKTQSYALKVIDKKGIVEMYFLAEIFLY